MSLAPGLDALLVLSPSDNVAVARAALRSGETVHGGGVTLVCAQDTPPGFKVAVRAIAPGAKIIKYGAEIGSAIRHIRVGDIVHLDNMKSDYIATHGRGDDAEGGAS